MLPTIETLVAIDALLVALIVTVSWLGYCRLRSHARNEAALLAATTIDHEIRERAKALEASIARFCSFVENTDAIAFEYDTRTQHLAYISPQVMRTLGSSSRRTRREFLGSLIHPDDRVRVAQTLAAHAARTDRERIALQYRLVRDDGKIVHVRTLLSDDTTDGLIRGIAIDITQQAKIETELRQIQKLESVGRLASGVAHEINTPVQYVQDSVQFVREAVTDLFDVISRHREVSTSVLAGANSRELAALAMETDETADLGYLLNNVLPALDRASEGLGRVTTIVHSLKSFAQLDHRKRSALDLNAAILSALEVARSEYKYVADVELDLEHELPRVDCFAGEINQVLLNVITNAAHAIQDAGPSEDRGLIRVRTRRDDDWVEISIGDTGCGIAEQLRERIFEPFFTTKKLGRGTGQGLSIARSVIVEKHGGTLTFDSNVGHGTTFTIRVPITEPTSPIGVAA